METWVFVCVGIVLLTVSASGNIANSSAMEGVTLSNTGSISFDNTPADPPTPIASSTTVTPNFAPSTPFSTGMELPAGQSSSSITSTAEPGPSSSSAAALSPSPIPVHKDSTSSMVPSPNIVTSSSIQASDSAGSALTSSSASTSVAPIVSRSLPESIPASPTSFGAHLSMSTPTVVTTTQSTPSMAVSLSTSTPSPISMMVSSSTFTPLSSSMTVSSPPTPASTSSVTVSPSMPTPVSSSVTVSPSMPTPVSSSVTVSPSMPTPVSSSVTVSPSMPTPVSSSVTVSPSAPPVFGSDNSARSLPLIIGSVASIVVLVFTNILQLLLCYFSTSKSFDFMHMNVVVSLICGLIFLLVGNAEAIWRDPLTCVVFSGLTTYFLLVPFVWLLAEAVFMNFYIRGIATGKYQIALVLLIFCFCWLLPGLVAVVTGVVATENTINMGPDRTLQQCWLSVSGGTIAAFLAPVAVLCLATVAVCLLLGWTLYSRNVKHEEQNLRRSVIYGLQCVGILLPLLTLTWVVASLYVSLGSSVLGFIYLVLIVITSIAIFIMYGIVKVVPLILRKFDKSNAHDSVELAPVSNTLTYQTAEADSGKAENNDVVSGPEAVGVTTFKPLESKAAETTHDGEGDKAAEKTTNGDKKEDEEKKADSAGNEAQGETSTGYSTFKPTQLAAASEVVAKSEPAKEGESTGKESGSDGLKSEAVKPENAGKESGSDALKSEPVKAEENVGKGSGSDQETPPQAEADTAPKSDPTQRPPEVAKATDTNESPLEAAGKTKEAKKEVPVEAKEKDKNSPPTEANTGAVVPTDKVDK